MATFLSSQDKNYNYICEELKVTSVEIVSGVDFIFNMRYYVNKLGEVCSVRGKLAF